MTHPKWNCLDNIQGDNWEHKCNISCWGKPEQNTRKTWLLTFFLIKALRQSSGRPVRCESLKLWRVKILFFFSLIYNWPDLFEQNTAISKHFTKPADYFRTTSGTIFSADVLISGGQVIFQYKPGAHL